MMIQMLQTGSLFADQLIQPVFGSNLSGNAETGVLLNLLIHGLKLGWVCVYLQ